MSINKGHKMVLEGRGRYINRKTPTSGKVYDRFFVYVPTDIARDSAFPFDEGEEVKIVIDVRNKRLVISKYDEK